MGGGRAWGGGGGASSVLGEADPNMEVAGRARAEGTWNIYSMSVTLDVSRLNDWLNADALCRVKREA